MKWLRTKIVPLTLRTVILGLLLALISERRRANRAESREAAYQAEVARMSKANSKALFTRFNSGFSDGQTMELYRKFKHD